MSYQPCDFKQCFLSVAAEIGCSRKIHLLNLPNCTMPTCALEGCEAEGVKPRGGRCAKCRSVSYCSRDHQREDWAQHKDDCKRIARLTKSLRIKVTKRQPVQQHEVFTPQSVSIFFRCGNPCSTYPHFARGWTECCRIGYNVPQLVGWFINTLPCFHSPLRIYCI